MEVTQSCGEYSIHTEGGQSGSPVYSNAEKTKVFGIHKGTDKKKDKNLCTLVS
jgi:V8-like Glu-specific endopeptidase